MENGGIYEGKDNSNAKTNAKACVIRGNQLNNGSSSEASSADQRSRSNQSFNRLQDDDDDNRKLFVGGLAHDVTEDQLKKYFSNFGDVTSINIKSDLMTKRPRGFGFVTFSTCDSINKVFLESEHSINGKKVDPKRAIARPKPPPIKKIFVGGLSPDTAESDVIKYFEKFGKVENVELPYDKMQNKRRAFCFVCFQEEKAALRATAEAKQTIPPMTKSVDVKIATPPKGDTFGVVQTYGGRRRGQYVGAYQGFCGFNYTGGYGQTYPGNGGFNQNYGAYGYGSGGYEYGYNEHYGSGYDGNFWNYSQNNYGGGYGDSQGSDDYTRDTM